jgi:cobaltochelatase CobN
VPAWVDAIFAGRPLAAASAAPADAAADVAAGAAPVARTASADLSGIDDARLREKVASALAEAEVWLRNLRDSAPRELASLTDVLAGHYLPSGPAGDPLRTPASLPSGRNLHGMDPSLIPTKAAWEVGKKLGAQFIARFKREHAGRDPERISMVLWHGETTRHQGAMESEALWLMGVEPIWNPRGVPDQLRLLADSEMDHPRVDVLFTVSGLYRDGFADKIQMLDRAARLVAAAGDNAISRQNRRTAETLRAAGVAPDDAASLAQGRVFGAAPGSYGFGLQQVVEQSKDVNNTRGMADLYLNRMNFVFTADAWGKQVPRLLEAQLAGNQAVIHSRSSNLYGVTDNDDFYQFVGGLNLVSREINGGAAPDLFLNNLRAGGRERVEDVRTALVTELTARNWNPKWIREMQQAGYSGAREMTRAIEFLYGWQATAPEIVDETLWQQAYDVYVADKNGLELERFFDRQGPHAYQALVARLLEIDRQGRHRFTDAERGRLVQQYVRSVNAHGAACSANTCGNLALHAYVMGQAGQASGLISGLGDLDWRAFGQRMALSTGWTARQFPTASLAAKAGMASAQQPRPAPATAATMAPRPPAQRAASANPIVSGFRMAETMLTLTGPPSAAGPRVLATTFAVIWGFLLIGAAREIAGGRRRRAE